MLKKYEDTDVKVISGNNFLRNKIKIKDHYYFSRFNHCWGWATWKSAWALYDGNFKDWEKFKKTKKWKFFFQTRLIENIGRGYLIYVRKIILIVGRILGYTPYGIIKDIQ